MRHALRLTICAAGLSLACSDSSADEGTEGTDSTADEDSSADEGSSGTEAGTETGSESSTDTDTDVGTETDAGTETDTSTTGGSEGSSACEDTELPLREGAEIVVSPGAEGKVMVDGQETSLRAVVTGASEGDTILLEDGTYTFTEAGDNEYTGVYVTTPNITIRSVSGDPSAVILDADYRGLGNQSAVITIDAPGVAVAGIGVRRSIFHLVHLWANADDVILHDLELIDGGQQFVKASVGSGEVDGVEVSCTRFEMTDAGRANVWGYGGQSGNTRCYTGGIDTHDSTNWTVRDSHFEGIYCDATEHPAHGKFPELRDDMVYTGGLAEHAIHMWDSAEGSGHVLTRNTIINCARGIGFGQNAVVHGGVITNNAVSSSFAADGSHDVGITVDRAVDTLVAHNTVYFSDPNSYGSGIEYRWAETSNLSLHGNLSNRQIRARDSATATLSDNRAEDADAGWFVDAAGGDLHLSQCDGPGEAALHPEVGVDIDFEERDSPTVIGADQCSP
ncbi:hypothetical protein G6O69_02080 [Pseudenhygromyxa sp. WMMC2535]|uniref:hypothetical protein n=1 Tax=Pseudenhygromyxa sp. WMMC2535 TaxID=2712867 RepID=UPI001554DDE9|nr:hypothetical protein [Pseudenhygromyxa sp. WMMC2535]NVB36603.1 hypothetical protein [Pseudenhygromyxa sp. WMMC2535]